jgi:hypothetical protein
MHSFRATLAAVVLATSTLLVSPASADEGGFDDPIGDVRNSNDTVHVAVSYASRVVVEVTARRLNSRAEQLFVFIDTHPRRFGPDYVTSLPYDRPETTYFSHVNSWRTGPGTHDTRQCRSASASITGDVTRIAFPSSCIGDPDRVRVATVMRFSVGDNGHGADWAPGFRTFGPFVDR